MASVTLVAKGKATSEALFNQLNDLLGTRCEIRTLYLDALTEEHIADDLLVFSSQACYALAKPYLDPKSPKIIARRSVNHHEIGKLLNIPAGSDVLLVNDYLFTAEETISLLKALGIDHLNYFPYAPEATSFPRLKTAVTPGEIELVPGFVEEIIDIQTRGMDFTTLFEILKFLGLADERANLLSAKYLRDMIELIKETKSMADQNKLMKSQLETILNTVHDGILAWDGDGRISVFNSVAGEILGISGERAIGLSLQDKSLPQEILSLWTKQAQAGEHFTRLNNRHLMVSRSPLERDGFRGQVLTLKDVTEIERLEGELRRKVVAQQHLAHYSFKNILGASAAVNQVKALAHRLAQSESPVLIQGESGTGKELFAQSIHNAGPRRKWPFVAVNVAALPENLWESELFGYVEGAFTGAKKEGAPGLFEQAHKGTLFLDEIGEAPLSFQVKLLRVLQEKQVRRIGGSKIIPVDVRIIAATNKVLRELTMAGRFRQDLFYRLNVLPLFLPPLRERREDVMTIAKDFYLRYFKGKPPLRPNEYFSLVSSLFFTYDWPGNIRELHNVVEYLVNISPDSPPDLQLLPAGVIRNSKNSLPPEARDRSTNALLNNALGLIAKAAKAGEPIGRRSLAAKLGITEAKARRLIRELAEEDLVNVSRGIKGLELTAAGLRASLRCGETIQLSWGEPNN
ncbi:RNA polymerase sigma factor 54 interaction domain protein [Acididesulfobacillus acetoxydans]|uniref:RNA polymerase sigma factor 54 interaction domain protein n=1 Tax=Acididesulfobacillus acetoxydans TaxID=1561005 RepID=A0A8S0WXM6_9FIRM|nr:sigma 54-interacting transcriptional regulator [Acididesulfobacillus acetoxydans]CAA7601051.1 RNA polymerase sigma factor 54 interaction domain protein [Acididesulfobacillus acetoxydans]CEJ06925.1 Signal-transduction and transcriptional-control protein [Acididesulfobacillus acetoxydans]